MPSHSANDRHFVHGECTGCLSKKAFAQLLSRSGLAVYERAHSINVYECECLTIEFDRNTEDEASIEGTAATAAVLRANAYRIHEVLSLANLRHWLEITDDVQNRLELLQHQWPE